MEKQEYRKTRELEEAHWWFVGMREITSSLLALERRNGHPWRRLLDAGCGTGGNFSFWRRYSQEVVGLDISPVALAFYQERGGSSLLGAAQCLPFASETFDAVSCLDVLSQLPPGYDSQALSEFARVLGPGGVLILRVPAYDWLRSEHDRILHTHHRYSASELTTKLKKAGFQVLRLSHANAFLFPLAAGRRLWQKAGLGKAETDLVPLPGPLNSIFLSALRAEAGLIKRISLPCGLSVMALARKASPGG